jgi:site-specific DNA-adenine methylase
MSEIKTGGEPLKQFFSYFGSKVKSAKLYPAPKHSVVIEPFAGSAGYSCNYPELEIRLFDIDPVIVGVWNFLIRATAQDIRILPLSEIEVSALSQPERDFIGFWWRRCGAVPSNSPVPWMRSGNYNYSFWSVHTRERIAKQIHRISHWTCRQTSFIDVPKITATYFIDPPYQAQGTSYRFSSKMINYPDLSNWVKSLPGQAIVCESLGADWMPFNPLYLMHTVKYKKSERMTQEMVFTQTSEAIP